jgi:hypothetical protein
MHAKMLVGSEQLHLLVFDHLLLVHGTLFPTILKRLLIGRTSAPAACIQTYFPAVLQGVQQLRTFAHTRWPTNDQSARARKSVAVRCLALGHCALLGSHVADATLWTTVPAVGRLLLAAGWGQLITYPFGQDINPVAVVLSRHSKLAQDLLHRFTDDDLPGTVRHVPVCSGERK